MNDKEEIQSSGLTCLKLNVCKAPAVEIMFNKKDERDVVKENTKLKKIICIYV